MNVQHCQVSCAGHPETKCLVENYRMWEKRNKAKSQYGDMSLFLDEIRSKGKHLAEQLAGKFANSSLVLKGLMFVNIFARYQ